MRNTRRELTAALIAFLILSSATRPASIPAKALAPSFQGSLDKRQQPKEVKTEEKADLDLSRSEMRELLERYNVDRGNLSRTYPVALSPTTRARFRQFYTQWRDGLAKLDFGAMGEDGRIDYLLFKSHLDHELRQLDLQAKQLAQIE